MTTGLAAILQSIRQNEIVTIDDDLDGAAHLAMECEDSAENGPVTEYWGTDEDGDEWRVHMRAATREACDE